MAHVRQQRRSPSIPQATPVVQREMDEGRTERSRQDSLAKELQQPRGGAGVKVPLTGELLSWVDAKQKRAEDLPNAKKDGSDPSRFKRGTISGTPFVWSANDDRAVAMNDVDQGYLGDCYLMAILAAIAGSHPEVIENMVSDNGDGTYTVRFPDGHVEPSVTTKFVTYTEGGEDAVYASSKDSALRGKELWVILIEKAWALRHSSDEARRKDEPEYLQVEGGRLKTSSSLGLTGKEAERFELPQALSADELFTKLNDHFVVGKLPVVLWSLKKEHKKKLNGSGKSDHSAVGKGPVHGNHGYALKGVDTKARTVDLYNPWGSEHQEDRDIPFIRRFFREVVFLGLKKPPTKKGSSTLPTTPEERVAEEGVPKEVLEASGFDAMVADFDKDLIASVSRPNAMSVVRSYAWRLWKEAKKRTQAGANSKEKYDPRLDDRPLYWARLRMVASIRRFSPKGYALMKSERLDLIELLEHVTRGSSGITFPERGALGLRHVLVSGFDPFGFDSSTGSRRQGNPSGAAALALDGTTLSAGKIKGRVEGVVFPVRFADFDQGIVERTFRPYLRGERAVDMIMTISQGGLTQHRKGPSAEHPGRRKRLEDTFELERWAGRRRTSGAPDNVGRYGAVKNKIPENMARGRKTEEFLDSTLPRRQIVEELRRRGKTKGTETEDETEFSFKHGAAGELTTGGKHKSKWKEPVALPAESEAVEGSGGGYLSNEIFYRTALLARGTEKAAKPTAEGSAVPVGHLHVPMIPPPTAAKGSARSHGSMLKRIIQMVKKIIHLALPHIGAEKDTDVDSP
jgi:pyrrolidone-carboxylate peptidase